MALLTDTDLGKILCTSEQWPDKNKLHIYPYGERCLTPVGYDLRVGAEYASAKDARMYLLRDGESITIRPSDTVLITTLEDVGMPQDRKLSAFITSKVSQVSKGLSHISTNIDPDWHGRLLIAIHNPSCNLVKLDYGDPFCTANFIQNISPSTIDCGKAPGRTDILLKQFVTDAERFKGEEARAHKRSVIITATIKVAVIGLFSGCGYWGFGPTAGFAAMVAIGVGLSGNIGSGWGRDGRG